ncbi:hypothetical protein LIER_34937 [Lithospermum erythrorhizon]|uniref:Serine/threonine-protein phosphatase 4 regulatory subunit 2 n=1 Tax=Lithospermum erythrorhizon TaxID=34254 RepID=A0AAV3NLA4_LITER
MVFCFAALDNFIEGPPFTLQRLCEILLVARDIYPNLSKLALALEKNLSVTSTLIICTDQYPPVALQKPSIADKTTKDSEAQSNTVENGVNPPTGDGDEIMAEVEDADVDDHMTIDIETFEEIVRSSESNPEPTIQS